LAAPERARIQIKKYLKCFFRKVLWILFEAIQSFLQHPFSTSGQPQCHTVLKVCNSQPPIIKNFFDLILLIHFRYIFIHEGVRGLFKGLGPNLMGVAPTRAIYFWSYNACKKKIDASIPKANRDTSLVHVVSAAAAGKFCL